MRLIHGRDLWAGLFFMAFGTWFAWRGQDYRFGSTAAMGPGFFPVVIAYCLIIVGAFVLLKAARAEIVAIDRPASRPLFFVLAAIGAFALLIEWLGLLPATLSAIVVAAPAAREFRWHETIALAFGMAFFSALVFIYALGQNMPMVRF